MEKPWLKFYEPKVLPSLEYPKTVLPSFLTHSASQFPQNPAVFYYGTEINYASLEDQVNRFANALIGVGVKPGDRVSIMLPNLPQCVIGYYGILKAGAIVVQTNPLYVERELEHQLIDSESEILIALDIFYPRIQNLIGKTPLKKVILTNVRDYLPFLLKFLYPIKAKKEGQWNPVNIAPPLYDFKNLLKEASPTPPSSIESDPENVALLQYTGGTTGIPKGVMLTHNNLVANTVQCRHWMADLKEGKEVFLSVIPFFHVYGMSVCMNLSIYIASAMVLLPKFKTDDVLKAINRYRPTIFPGVQAMYVAINNHPQVKKYDISSIQACISGAGPLQKEVQDQFEKLTGGKLVEGFGLTEASPVTHANPISGLRKKGSIGLPFPDTNARVVDMEEGTNVLSVGEIGELVVQGPQVMKGYWKKEEETQQVLREGWLHTGDMARMDEEGYFYIVDRKKDMIKTSGENVYPRDVEEVLFQHPKVKEAVIAGLPDQFLGEKIKAYIVLKEGETASEEEILQFCRERLAKFKVPKQIEFRQELPKTMIGKILRRVLLEEELKKLKVSA
ncbi:MAG TPA: long-chain fatty acid--CoA ligase [Nitrospiria bacterium]